MLWLVAACAALGAVIYALGARERVFAISAGGPHWFVALKRSAAQPLELAPGVTVAWNSRADFTFIGDATPYWTDFLVLRGGAEGKKPLTLVSEDDAYVARVALVRPPTIALGVLKLLVMTGLLSRPQGEVLSDAHALGHAEAFMPSAESIAGLMTRAPDYAPAMVNFLAYKGAEGARAYARYGRVAMRTVYRTGGQLLFYGRVVEVVREPRAGPTQGRWDDVAAMRYNRPEGILSMEHAPDYRAVLHDRDAGLERTIVVASTPGAGS